MSSLIRKIKLGFGVFPYFSSHCSFYVYVVLLVTYTVLDSKNAWNQGLGFDGATYFRYFQCLPGCLFEIDSYHVNRLLFPSVAKGVFVALSIVQSAENFIVFSLILNCIVLIGSYYLCLQMLIKSQQQYLQWLLLCCFVAYPLFKGPVFYPTLGDYTSCFIFTGLCYAFQRRWLGWMCILSILGYFCHALLLPVSIVLFGVDANKRWALSSRNYKLIEAIALGGICVFGVSFIYNDMVKEQSSEAFITDLRFVLFSLPFTMLLMLMIASRVLMLLKPCGLLKHYSAPALNFRLLFLFIFIMASLSYAKSMFPSEFIKGAAATWFLTHLIYNSSERVYASIASSFLYFGPFYIFSLVMFFFHRAKQELHVSHAIILSLFFLLSMRPESRTVMFFWPVVAVITLQSYGSLIVQSRFVLWMLVVVSVATSQALFPTAIVEQYNRQLVSSLYFNYQGGYQSVATWAYSLCAALLLGLVVVFVYKDRLRFDIIPRRYCRVALCYLFAASLLVYICSFSMFSTLAKETLCLVPRDLLTSGNTLLVNHANMGDLEHDSLKSWKWSFGPYSEISFISLSKEQLTLELELYAPVQDQVMWISINNGTPLRVDLGLLPLREGYNDGRRYLSTPFIPRYGINTILLSYNLWGGNGIDVVPGEGRKFAVQFLKFTVSAPIPDSYRHSFPYYLFLYGDPRPRVEYAIPTYP